MMGLTPTFAGFSPGTSPAFVHADLHLMGFQPFSPGSTFQHQLQKPPPPTAQLRPLPQAHQISWSYQQPGQEHLLVPALRRPVPHRPLLPLQALQQQQQQQHRYQQPQQQHDHQQHKQQQQCLHDQTHSDVCWEPAQTAQPVPSTSGQSPQRREADCKQQHDNIPASEFLRRAEALMERAHQLWTLENYELQRGSELQVISTSAAAAAAAASSPNRLEAGYTPRNFLGNDSLSASPLALSFPGCSPNAVDSLTALLLQPGSTPASALRLGPFSYPSLSQGTLFDNAGAVLAALNGIHTPRGGPDRQGSLKRPRY